MKEYKILEAGGSTVIEKLINVQAAEGWTLVGPVVRSDWTTSCVYVATMEKVK